MSQHSARKNLPGSKVGFEAALGAVLAAVFWTGAVQADPLQGNVQETGATEVQPDLAPIAPMPVPVIRQKKPISGSAQDNTLKGNAEDQDQDLNAQKPALDSSRGRPLQGSAVTNDSDLQAQDPDSADHELLVEWDKWHNRLLWSIQSGVQELINSPENVEPHFDQRTGRVILGPNLPLGTKATFWVRVSADRRIMKAKIIQPSGFPDYDKALLDAIYALDGSSILRFPRGSQRQRVNETATIITSDRGDREFFKFGDVERRRVPGD